MQDNYTVREFQIDSPVKNEGNFASQKEAEAYALASSKETANEVNVIDVEHDEIVATYQNGQAK